MAKPKVDKVMDKMNYISSIQMDNDEENKTLIVILEMLKTQKFTVVRDGKILYVGKHEKDHYLNELHLRCLLDDRRETYGKTIAAPKCSFYDENFTVSPEVQKLFDEKAEKKKKAAIQVAA